MPQYRYAQTNIQLFAQLRELGFSAAAMTQLAAADVLARRLASGQYCQAGKPFLAHLVGTASIVAAHGGSAPEVTAALLHAAYDVGDFGSPVMGMTPARRETVRAAAGAETEAIVADFHGIQWKIDTWADILRRLEDIAEEKRSALFIRVANELEELVDDGILYASAPRQRDFVGAVDVCREICRVLNLPALWAEFEESYARCTASSPAVILPEQHYASYFELPATFYRRPWPWLVESACRLARLLLPQSLRRRIRRALSPSL